MRVVGLFKRVRNLIDEHEVLPLVTVALPIMHRLLELLELPLSTHLPTGLCVRAAFELSNISNIKLTLVNHAPPSGTP